jgi:hypothetical protein
MKEYIIAPKPDQQKCIFESHLKLLKEYLKEKGSLLILQGLKDAVFYDRLRLSNGDKILIELDDTFPNSQFIDHGRFGLYTNEIELEEIINYNNNEVSNADDSVNIKINFILPKRVFPLILDFFHEINGNYGYSIIFNEDTYMAIDRNNEFGFLIVFPISIDGWFKDKSNVVTDSIAFLDSINESIGGVLTAFDEYFLP